MCHSVLILVFYVFVCEMWSLDDAFTLICCSIFLKKIGLNFRGFIPFWFKWPSRVWLFWFRLWSCEWAWRVHLVLILAPRGDFDLTLIWFCLVLAPSDLWSDFDMCFFDSVCKQRLGFDCDLLLFFFLVPVPSADFDFIWDANFRDFSTFTKSLSGKAIQERSPKPWTLKFTPSTLKPWTLNPEG